MEPWALVDQNHARFHLVPNCFGGRGRGVQAVLRTKPSSVIIKNVYCFMAHAFRAVGMEEYRRIGSEEFEVV